MFKNLEDLKLEMTKAEDSGSEAVCNCLCGEVQESKDKDVPESNSMAIAVSVHYDLNG